MSEKWKVTADHSALARPDKHGLSRQSATAYADSLRPLGYENISIILQDTPASDERPVVDEILYQSAVSGMWYTNPKAAGDISAIKINGELFAPLQEAVELIMGHPKLIVMTKHNYVHDNDKFATKEEVINLIQGEKG